MVQLFHIKGGALFKLRIKLLKPVKLLLRAIFSIRRKIFEVKSGALVAAGVNFQEQDGKQFVL